jgi:hypothetical protein
VDQRFVPLNALIAFCYPYQTGWPRPFFEAGFVLQSLEFPANSGEGRVVIDAVTWSRTDTHFVLCESKSGANIDEAQAKKYGSVQTNTLVQMLGVTVSGGALPDSQALYLTTEENVDRIEMGLASAGVSYPILAIGSDSVTRHGRAITNVALAERFSSPLSIPGPPPGIITIDLESSNEVFDQIVQPCLVALLASHEQAVSIHKLAEEAIPSLPLYPNGYRNRLIRKIEDAARRAADAASENFIFAPRSGVNNVASIRIVESPENLDPRGRTQSYQRLATRFAPSSRRRRIVVASNQPTLFDDATYRQELAELDSLDENDVEEGNDGSK